MLLFLLTRLSVRDSDRQSILHMRIVLAHLVAADSKFYLNAASFALLKEHAMFCSTYLTPHLLICLCRHYT